MDQEVLELMRRQTEALESLAATMGAVDVTLDEIRGALENPLSLDGLTNELKELKTMIGQVCGPEVRINSEAGFYVRVKAVPSDY